MSENQGANQLVQQTDKKFKVRYLLLSLLPFGIIIELQAITSIPGLIIAAAELMREGNMNFDTDLLLKAYSDRYAIWGYVAYCIIALIVFGIWYRKWYVRKAPKIDYNKAFVIRPLLLSLAVVLALYFVVAGVMEGITLWSPSLLDDYNKLVESAGLDSNNLIIALYAVTLGPAVEELCFRGLVYAYLEKSRMNYILVIIIQGVLFGIMHLNVVQGIYASLLGIVLGTIRYKYKSIILTILAHVSFNLVGTYGSQAINNMGIESKGIIIAGAIALIISAVCYVLIVKDKRDVVIRASDKAEPGEAKTI